MRHLLPPLRRLALTVHRDRRRLRLRDAHVRICVFRRHRIATVRAKRSATRHRRKAVLAHESHALRERLKRKRRVFVTSSSCSSTGPRSAWPTAQEVSVQRELVAAANANDGGGPHDTPERLQVRVHTPKRRRVAVRDRLVGHVRPDSARVSEPRNAVGRQPAAGKGREDDVPRAVSGSRADRSGAGGTRRGATAERPPAPPLLQRERPTARSGRTIA